MTDSNRLRLTVTRDPAPTDPLTTPRMRTARITGESLRYAPQFINSDEIRDDRMMSDPIKIGETNSGDINFELSYPVDGSPLSDMFASSLYSDWLNTPQRDNDGTADSVISAVTASTGVFAVATGPAFAAGHLIRATGFSSAGNNGLFRVTTGSATVPAVGAALLTDETAPPAAARVKVVGFQGVSGDITALADGLGSTALDFTTLGLGIGQVVKIGGAGATYRFATALNNGFARVIAISATKLTLDSLPTGWTADVGTGKTIRVFFGDMIKNGVTTLPLAIERGFMGQAVPTYILQRGMEAGQGSLGATRGEKITGSFSFMGISGQQSIASVDATPDAATTNAIMSANVNVGRIYESGAVIPAPNYVQSMQLQWNNNQREQGGVGYVGLTGVGVGEFSVTATLETRFGSNLLLEKLLNGTPGNLMTVMQKNNQAVIPAVPRMTFTDGSPSAGGKNQDVMLPLTASASKDSLTEAHLIINRLEYFET